MNKLESTTQTLSRNRPWLTLLGCVCVALAVVGVLLPVMPTTVFVLCAAWCFSRSNQRFYSWLINHQVFGQCVRGWQEGRAIPRKAFLKIMLILWGGLSLSSLLMNSLIISCILVLVGCSVSIYLWLKSEYHLSKN